MKRILIIGEYVYHLWNSGRVVVVPLKKIDKTQEELLRIINALKEYRESQLHKGAPRRGQWQWCADPDCQGVVYISPSYIHDGQNYYCSNRCRSKVVSVARDGCWIKNINPKSPVCGQVGEIISVSDEGVVRVDFSERCEFGKRVIRVYRPGFNLNFMVRVPSPKNDRSHKASGRR